jgi:hypothetical protein
MSSKTLCVAMIVALASVIGLGASAQAQTLSLSTTETSVDPDQSFEIWFNVDDAAGVAGAALTISYDGDAFGVDEINEGDEDYFLVGSDLFGLVTDSRQPPGTPEQAVTSIGNQDSEPEKVLLSGAWVDPADGGGADGGPLSLFKVKFAADSTPVPGFYTFTGMNSEICNLDAGWGNDDGDGVCEAGEEETVPALVGAVASGEPGFDNFDCSNPPCAFPILVNTFTPVTVEVKIPDGDTIDDDWERQQWGDKLDVANDDTDDDQDGYLDPFEQPEQFGGNNTNPKEQDEAWVLPNYDPATDNRGPYQVVSADPEETKGPSGESFSIDVNYESTDGQDVDGLLVKMFFDSTKLTWDSLTDLFATGLPSPFTPTTSDDTTNLDDDDDTDKYVEVEWNGGDWPGTVPAKLYTANFTAAEGLEDDVTSSINFTFDEADGYLPHTESGTFTVMSIICGDVNDDGVVDSGDAILILQYSVGLIELTENQLRAGDCNNDGVVDSGDAILVLQFSVGLIGEESLTCP